MNVAQGAGIAGRAPGSKRRGRWDQVAVALAGAVVLWFYGWTVWSTGERWRWGEEQRDYYNLLIDGWSAGQLHMKVEVPAAMLQLKDPYDPAQRPPGLGLHDASFFQGRYYVYFGVAPVVTLMWPWRVVTGVDMPLVAAVLVFVSAGFLVSVGMLLELRWRFFAGASTWVVVAGVAALGWVSPGVVLLRRPDMWELPIAGGFCFAMAALWCVLRTVTSGPGAGRPWWMAATGLALGLAVASRPTYLFATPLLLVPWGGWWWRERRVPWREGWAAVIPLALVGAAMAWHNHARFGDALQFGQAYQLSLDYESKQPHFGARYVPYNVRQHFLGGARWDRYYPFLQAPVIAPAPEGYTRHRGDVFGILANYPIAWLAWVAPVALWRRSVEERRALRTWIAAVAVLFVATAAVMCSFFSALARYQVEFAPAWMVLAATGTLAVERWARERRGRGAIIFTTAMVAAAAWSAATGVLVTLQIDGLLRERNLPLAERLARGLNHVPAWAEKLMGIEHGAVDVRIALPRGKESGEEAIAIAGEGPRAEQVVLRYVGAGRAQLGFRAPDAPERWADPVEFGPGTRRLRINWGALYPPRTHPFFGDMTDAEAVAVIRGLRIAVDDRVVLEGYHRSEGRRRVRIGREAGFSGDVIKVRRARERIAVRAVEAGDTLRLRVRWPEGKPGAREPLVVTGRPGAGDFVAVEYLGADAVRFHFDHWGVPGIASEVVATQGGTEHVVEITMASLATVTDATRAEPARSGLWRVRVNGVTVVERRVEFYTAEPGEIAVGVNPIGGTSCGPRFTGELREVKRVAPVK